jgi:hypothetical protein
MCSFPLSTCNQHRSVFFISTCNQHRLCFLYFYTRLLIYTSQPTVSLWLCGRPGRPGTIRDSEIYKGLNKEIVKVCRILILRSSRCRRICSLAFLTQKFEAQSKKTKAALGLGKTVTATAQRDSGDSQAQDIWCEWCACTYIQVIFSFFYLVLSNLSDWTSTRRIHIYYLV